MQIDPVNKAKQAVIDYYNENDITDDVVPLTLQETRVVWFTKTLRSWKAIITADLPDSNFWEVTYNDHTKILYISTYKKIRSHVKKDYKG